MSLAHKRYSLSLSTTYEPRTYEEDAKCPEWCKAMEIEYQALVSNNTWTVTLLLAHKRHVDCKWVFKVKLNSNGTEERMKARLVAKGFMQQAGLDYEETFFPIDKLVTVKSLLAIAAHKCWHLHQLDINNAFLYGDLDEEVYIWMPKGYEIVFSFIFLL